MSAKLLEFPERDVTDVPRGLRSLADSIMNGEFGGAHNLVWAIDCGDGKVEVGLLGQAAETGPVAHFLMCLAQQKLLSGTLKEGA
jgi:hypothetical protein